MDPRVIYKHCLKQLLLFRVRATEHIVKQFNKLRGVIVCQGPYLCIIVILPVVEPFAEYTMSLAIRFVEVAG